jgi:hypothetical protein
VLDARQGDLPVVGTMPLSAPARHIAVQGSRAFLSLGRVGQVAIAELSDPSAPAPAGTLSLSDPLQGTHLVAQQTQVIGNIAYVAAGQGKVQRFLVPIGSQPVKLESAALFGDAQSFAFMGRYLLVASILFESEGSSSSCPSRRPRPSAWRARSPPFALPHLELVGTSPADGELTGVNQSLHLYLMRPSRSHDGLERHD